MPVDSLKETSAQFGFPMQSPNISSQVCAGKENGNFKPQPDLFQKPSHVGFVPSPNPTVSTALS